MKSMDSQTSIVQGHGKEQILETKDSRLGSREFKLYLITDRRLFSATCSMYFAIESALDGGANVIQLRENDLPVRELFDMAVWMRELTNEYGAKLIINDRIDVALSVEADGVHLGRKSMPAHAVRKMWGNRLMIGVSTHGIEEALDAERDGADFITLGPVYRTPSKLKYGDPLGVNVIRGVKKRISIPVFAIGGIKPDRVREVRGAGADGVAVISAILGSRDIEGTTEEFLRLLK